MVDFDLIIVGRVREAHGTVAVAVEGGVEAREAMAGWLWLWNVEWRVALGRGGMPENLTRGFIHGPSDDKGLFHRWVSSSALHLE